MSNRRTAGQIERLSREADRDLAKGLTVFDLCLVPLRFDEWR